MASSLTPTPSTSRPYLFNVVVSLPQGETPPGALPLVVAELSKRHSCRLLLLPSLGEVSAYPTHFSILSQLIPDLPIYLLWGHDPVEDLPLLSLLLPFAKRLIFDLSSSKRSSLGAFTLEKTLPTLSSEASCELMDLSWARLMPWRRALAQLFNGEEALAELHQAHTITLSMASKEGVVPKASTPENYLGDYLQGLYLISWLTSRLGWHWIDARRTSEGCSLTCQKTPSQDSVQFILQSSPHELDPGTLLSLEISGTKASYSLGLYGKRRIAIVHITREDRCDMPFTVPMQTTLSTPSFMQELLHARVSIHYPTAMQYLAEIPWSSFHH